MSSGILLDVAKGVKTPPRAPSSRRREARQVPESVVDDAPADHMVPGGQGGGGALQQVQDHLPEPTDRGVSFLAASAISACERVLHGGDSPCASADDP